MRWGPFRGGGVVCTGEAGQGVAGVLAAQPAADFDTEQWAGHRIVRWVRRYSAPRRTRPSGGGSHGRPRPGASTPLRRRRVTDRPKAHGLDPENGTLQEGSDALVTPAAEDPPTAGSLTGPHLVPPHSNNYAVME